MKRLLLTNTNFKAILSFYKEWLLLLGYSPSTVYQLPNHLREFFYYLERQGVSDLKSLKAEHIEAYYAHLKQRTNTKWAGGLSSSYLNKHQQALERFKAFLNDHSDHPIYFNLKKEKTDRRSSESILTQSEVKQLFEATHYSHKLPKIRSRDRAMLVLLYSLGLRRNEVCHVHCQDINHYKGTLHVRQGKNYTERLIPINQKNLETLLEYQNTYRQAFLVAEPTDALLLNYRGGALGGRSLADRLKALQKLTQIDKPLTPHILRHSIATHLLQSGASIEQISHFLGHRSLESTQLYTHLIH